MTWNSILGPSFSHGLGLVPIYKILGLCSTETWSQIYEIEWHPSATYYTLTLFVSFFISPWLGARCQFIIYQTCGSQESVEKSMKLNGSPMQHSPPWRWILASSIWHRLGLVPIYEIIGTAIFHAIVFNTSWGKCQYIKTLGLCTEKGWSKIYRFEWHPSVTFHAIALNVSSVVSPWARACSNISSTRPVCPESVVTNIQNQMACHDSTLGFDVILMSIL